MNFEIARISFNLFLIISGVPIIFTILGFVTGFMPKIKEYKEKLKNKIGKDKEANVSYLPEKHERKLLEFDDKKYLIFLGIASLIAIIFIIIYGVSLSIEPLSSHENYEILVSICTWIGLLPALIAIYSALRLYIYFVQLYSNNSDR